MFRWIGCAAFKKVHRRGRNGAGRAHLHLWNGGQLAAKRVHVDAGSVHGDRRDGWGDVHGIGDGTGGLHGEPD